MKLILDHKSEFCPLQKYSERKTSTYLKILTLSVEVVAPVNFTANSFDVKSPPDSPIKLPTKNHRGEVVYQSMSDDFDDEFDINFNALMMLEDPGNGENISVFFGRKLTFFIISKFSCV